MAAIKYLPGIIDVELEINGCHDSPSVVNTEINEDYVQRKYENNDVLSTHNYTSIAPDLPSRTRKDGRKVADIIPPLKASCAWESFSLQNNPKNKVNGIQNNSHVKGQQTSKKPSAFMGELLVPPPPSPPESKTHMATPFLGSYQPSHPNERRNICPNSRDRYEQRTTEEQEIFARSKSDKHPNQNQYDEKFNIQPPNNENEKVTLREVWHKMFGNKNFNFQTPSTNQTQDDTRRSQSESRLGDRPNKDDNLMKHLSQNQHNTLRSKSLQTGFKAQEVGIENTECKPKHNSSSNLYEPGETVYSCSTGSIYVVEESKEHLTKVAKNDSDMCHQLDPSIPDILRHDLLTDSSNSTITPPLPTLSSDTTPVATPQESPDISRRVPQMTASNAKTTQNNPIKEPDIKTQHILAERATSEGTNNFTKTLLNSDHTEHTKISAEQSERCNQISETKPEEYEHSENSLSDDNYILASNNEDETKRKSDYVATADVEEHGAQSQNSYHKNYLSHNRFNASSHARIVRRERRSSRGRNGSFAATKYSRDAKYDSDGCLTSSSSQSQNTLLSTSSQHQTGEIIEADPQKLSVEKDRPRNFRDKYNNGQSLLTQSVREIQPQQRFPADDESLGRGFEVAIRKNDNQLVQTLTHRLNNLEKSHAKLEKQFVRVSKTRKRGFRSSVSSSDSTANSFAVRRMKTAGHNYRETEHIKRRFQRLESHVVTLARSLAQLSSEVRSNHASLEELADAAQESKTNYGVENATIEKPKGWMVTFRNNVRSVNKLRQFFGEEPPMLDVFLENLGYENYKENFLGQCINVIELPYMNENRLENIGIPLGPRCRIIQEAKMCFHNQYFKVYYNV